MKTPIFPKKVLVSQESCKKTQYLQMCYILNMVFLSAVDLRGTPIFTYARELLLNFTFKNTCKKYDVIKLPA